MPASILSPLVWLAAATVYVFCLASGNQTGPVALVYALMAVICVALAVSAPAERSRCACGRYRR